MSSIEQLLVVVVGFVAEALGAALGAALSAALSALLPLLGSKKKQSLGVEDVSKKHEVCCDWAAHLAKIIKAFLSSKNFFYSQLTTSTKQPAIGQ